MLGSIRTLLKRFRGDQRGATLVEMTVITPVMIALGAGVFEFSNLIHKKLLIEAGLRDAARYVARCNPDFFTVATCETRARNIAVYGSVVAGPPGSERVDGWSTAQVTVDRDFGSVAAVDGSGNRQYRSTTANVLTARAGTSFTYSGTSLLAYVGVGPITLTASQEERVVGW